MAFFVDLKLILNIFAAAKNNRYAAKKHGEIERACCPIQFCSVERPWMCISVDQPLWEGSKPVSIPRRNVDSSPVLSYSQSHAYRNPFPILDRKSRVLDDWEEGAACREWGSWSECPSQDTSLSDEGRDSGERERIARNSLARCKLHCEHVTNCLASRGRCRKLYSQL